MTEFEAGSDVIRAAFWKASQSHMCMELGVAWSQSSYRKYNSKGLESGWGSRDEAKELICKIIKVGKLTECSPQWM